MRYSAKFGDVDAALAALHRVASGKRTAFQARIKNFQRLGLLDDVKAGRGKAAAFEAHHILMLALALELNEFAIGPERATELLKRSEGEIALQVRTIILREREGRPATIICHVPANQLEQLTGETLADLGLKFFHLRETLQRLEFIGETQGLIFRAALFSLSGLVTFLPEFLKPNDPGYRRAFNDQLANWAEERADAFLKAAESQRDVRILSEMKNDGELETGGKFAVAVGLADEWQEMLKNSDG